MIKTATVRYWVTLVMVIVIVSSVIAWLVTWPRLPKEAVLLTGTEGGQYYKLGREVEDSIQNRLGPGVLFRVEPTTGSKVNYRRLIEARQRGESRVTYLAIMQGGSVPIHELATIAPLYPELVHVVVRAESDIHGIADLVGRRIALGLEGSGNRLTAIKLLGFYDVNEDQLFDNQHYFIDLLDEKLSLEGAIVTTGIQHPDLTEMLGTGDFRLLAIGIAPAVEMADPFLHLIEIPKGLYSQDPPVPSEPVTTLATTSYLVTSESTDSRVVEAALEAVYEDNLRIEFPNLIARNEAPARVSTRLHPDARVYFHPADNLGLMATILESMAATKELLLAVAAMIYLLWQRWRRAIQREQQQQFSSQKEHLDTLLEKTLEIETELVACSDMERLDLFLRQVTGIKVSALREFTDEALRGDSTFTIFLQQCDGLIKAIQLKIIDTQRGTA